MADLKITIGDIFLARPALDRIAAGQPTEAALALKLAKTHRRAIGQINEDSPHEMARSTLFRGATHIVKVKARDEGGIESEREVRNWLSKTHEEKYVQDFGELLKAEAIVPVTGLTLEDLPKLGLTPALSPREMAEAWWLFDAALFEDGGESG